jgi:DNA mismatch repair protein MutL
MPIHILSDEVASQIAAGEVVERPASVVKELAENALDAGAGQITIHIVDAGRRLIEIADNGAGIAINEMDLAISRHATSKLSSADDLFHIQTLGFRGEALASIASVSHFTLVSRAEDAEVGARLVVDGGRAMPLERLGVPVGTVIRVEDLFYNVPARLKFLKRDLTERQQVDALVTRYALAYPKVRFHLFQDDRPVLQTSGRGDRLEVLAGLYGPEIARQMLEVNFADEGISVSGFISPVALTRSNRKEITLFINGRWVQDAALSAALLQAYHTLLMVGRYPIAALFIQLPAEEVDVNVHPAKAEVRFRSPDRIFSAVQRAARRALLAYSPVPAVSGNTWQPPDSSWRSRSTERGEGPGLDWRVGHTEGSLHAAPWETQTPASAGVEAGENAAGGASAESGADGEEPGPFDEQGEGPGLSAGPQTAPAVPETPAQAELPGSGLPLLRLVGQVGSSYLVAEGPDGLYLIDQHAAHERVLFERFMRQRSTSIPSQALLEASMIHLPPPAARLLQDNLAVLERIGFQVEPFGPNTFRVRALPALLAGIDPQAAVRVVVEDFEEDETPLQTEMEEKIIARVCKRAAVKAGQSLSPVEQAALLRELEACRSPRTCPHGRPTMIHLSVDLLERQFGRRGSR